MEVNSVNNTVPVDRQTLNIENQEPVREEATETATQENREAYRVNLSEEALRAQQASPTETPEALPAGPQGSEAVQTYTNAGQLAG